MEVREAIRTRRSIRTFTEEPVSEDMLQVVLEAAMLAPSAGNQQPWHFIVVTDRDRLAAVPDFHPYAGVCRQAGTAVIVCGSASGIKWPDFWVQDCAAATQNLLLAARDLGLGSVWCGIYPLEERMKGMREIFSIPDHIFPFAIVPLGWPAAEFKPVDRYRAELVHKNSW